MASDSPRINSASLSKKAMPAPSSIAKRPRCGHLPDLGLSDQRGIWRHWRSLSKIPSTNYSKGQATRAMKPG
jgi:hypothetical protein